MIPSRLKHAYASAFAILAIAIHPGCWGGSDASQTEEPTLLPSLEIPFTGSGRLVTLWSAGVDEPGAAKALRVTSKGETSEIACGAPTRVRWLSQTDLVLEERTLSGTEWLTRLTRISQTGEVLEVLCEDPTLSNAEPSQDGQWIALQTADQQTNSGIEIRSMPTFRHHTDHAKRGRGLGQVSPVWSPDGSMIAVAWFQRNPRGVGGRGLFPRLAIAERDNPGFERINDELVDVRSKTWSVTPLFWIDDGIYARGNDDLVRCDPRGDGCEVVYSPGQRRAVSGGQWVGGRKALLLVRDLRVDLFDVRAKELHEVNLETGEGRVLLRLPTGVFISDLDWVSDPASAD